MNNRILALLAAFGASLIYGINHTVAKDVMPTFIQPFGFILLRVSGAAILFWIISIWGPKEKIDKKDWPRLACCAVFGMVINMLMFFKGLSLSTPINSAVIVTLTPIIVFILSAIIIKERVTFIRTFGILLGFAGALGLVLFGENVEQGAPNIALGNILFMINATSYGIYLVLVKPLTAKYHAFTIMRWLFTIGIIINIPFTITEFTAVKWTSLPFDAIWRMAFVVVGTTFSTYLLNIFALKQLKASTIGAFVYLQPLIGILFAIIVGADKLTFVKVIAAGLVFLGVYMVTKTKKPPVVEEKA
ncbi:DMT family transporter [Galbibacter pacificus]|uniref:DMT family transporter n=1 Tax=Galbibacter pacificus TaxID=2996052 RepID=A0ABT6FTP7_9FLAO|nr:DMT family transporter [Galbibacter pacificus]MDG3583155.1 DMT family transporter [Galbibacter pacificus]MDG3586636.1 DMT family transporter [Galbibacter pacificus]